jgi:hypothetical protein
VQFKKTHANQEDRQRGREQDEFSEFAASGAHSYAPQVALSSPHLH